MKAKNYTSKLSLALLFSLLTFQFLNAQSAILTPEGGVKANKLHDSDNDTKVIVEDTLDDNRIRFHIEGKEIGVMDTNTFHLEHGLGSLFIGKDAGINSGHFSSENSGVGYQALTKNTDGIGNVSFGAYSLKENLGGDYNSANGHNALSSNTQGNNNVAFGRLTLSSIENGNFNSAVGAWAGISIRVGSENVFLGSRSGNGDTLSNKNVYLGFESGGIPSYKKVFGPDFKREGNVFIGYKTGIHEIRSNRLYIDNSDSKTPLIYGNFEDDSLKVNGNLEVAENVKTSGFTQLGNESPAIKLKTILDTSPTVMGVSKSIAHGLSASQIINVSIYINNSVQNWIPPNYDGGPNYEYDYYFNHSSIIIKTVAGNSANVIDKPMKILITYTE